MSQDFLPQDYKAPTGGGFTKLEPGENRFRILSNPLLVWLIWNGGACTRSAYLDAGGQVTQKPAKGTGEKDSVKHAWAMIVYNYKTEKIEILEIDSVAIITALTNHAKDKDWGHPKGYDIVITKSGSGLETKYALLAKPHKELEDHAKTAYLETPIDLNQLLVSGGNPFIAAGGAPASTPPAQQQAKTVTPENWAPGDPAPVGYTVSPDGTSIQQAAGRPF